MSRNEVTAPLTFKPIFIERMWGGRRLESEFYKKLPPQKRIGESWELVDRSEAQSVVASGPLMITVWKNVSSGIFVGLKKRSTSGRSDTSSIMCASVLPVSPR